MDRNKTLMNKEGWGVHHRRLSGKGVWERAFVRGGTRKEEDMEGLNTLTDKLCVGSKLASVWLGQSVHERTKLNFNKTLSGHNGVAGTQLVHQVYTTRKPHKIYAIVIFQILNIRHFRTCDS